MREVRKTFKIKAVSNFNSEEFLSRVYNSSLEATLNIVIDGRTEIFLSISGKPRFLDKGTEIKVNAFENLIDGCSFEESEIPGMPDGDIAIINVMGAPSPSESLLENLISKMLETGMGSRIFVNISPAQIGGSYLFNVGFSLLLYSDSQYEIEKNIAMAVPLIKSIFGGGKQSVEILIDKGRKAKRNMKKLVEGKRVYTTILGMEYLSIYFQLPLTYGIETVKKMDFPVPSSPFEGIEIGELAEYSIQEIERARLNPSRLFEHMAVWGASGAGKTTFLKNLLIKLSETDVKFCLIDWHNEYRDIINLLRGKLGEDILVFNPLLTNFSINCLEIPEVENREIIIWERIENFISLMKQMFVIGEIQEGKIRRTLSDLYLTNNSPTIGDLIRELKDKKMGSLVLKLEKFTKGLYGRIFNLERSTLSFRELRKKNVIFELGGLPGEVRIFFVCVLLILWWDYLRMGESAPHVLALDDFQRYSELSVVKKMLSEARKFRQGLICSHQGPYQLSEKMRAEVVRNTATKVIFRQEQTWDKYIVRDALGGLDKEQLENLSYLDTGEAIAKLPSVKFPMRVNTPPPPEGQHLQDWEVREAMKKFTKEAPPEPEKPMEREPIEKKFLEEVYTNPYVPIPQIAKTLEIKTKRCYDLKRRLVRTGYLIEEEVRIGKGRPRKALKLTEKGLGALGKKGKNPAHHGGSEHIFMVNRIASILRKNWTVGIEKGCDVRAEKDGYKVAIEVETGKTNEKEQVVYNVKRDMRWADKVVVVCPNKEARLKIKERLGGIEKVVTITYSEVDEMEEFLNGT